MTETWSGATSRRLRSLMQGWTSADKEYSASDSRAAAGSAAGGSPPAGSEGAVHQGPTATSASSSRSRASLSELWRTPSNTPSSTIAPRSPSKAPVFPPSRRSLDDFKQRESVAATALAPEDGHDIDRILLQAGTSQDPYDPEDTRQYPLSALCACRLPSNSQPDALANTVARFTDRLEAVATNQPYLLVLFSSPSPSYSLVQFINIYRALPRGVRKGVKRLWICHPGFFTKAAVTLFLNTILSGKVTRNGKLKLADSLAELSQDVDISRFPLPAAILMHDASIRNAQERPKLGRGAIFGSTLTEAMPDPAQLPQVLAACINHLRSGGRLATVGLFRTVPKMTHLEILRNAFDAGQLVDLADWRDDAELAASLIKAYLSSLPYALVSPEVYADISKAPLDESSAAEWIKKDFQTMLERRHPDGARAVVVLRELCKLMHEVAEEVDQNKMTAFNLAVVVTPSLVHSLDVHLDAAMCRMPTAASAGSSGMPHQTVAGLMKVAIDRADHIFASPPTCAVDIRPHSTSSQGSATMRIVSPTRALSSRPAREHVRGVFADAPPPA